MLCNNIGILVRNNKHYYIKGAGNPSLRTYSPGVVIVHCIVDEQLFVTHARSSTRRHWVPLCDGEGKV